MQQAHTQPPGEAQALLQSIEAQVEDQVPDHGDGGKGSGKQAHVPEGAIQQPGQGRSGEQHGHPFEEQGVQYAGTGGTLGELDGHETTPQWTGLQSHRLS